MSKTAKMQDKVAKLLRQAEDVAGTPEEAVFQAKAFELIAKYGLDMAMIEAAKAGLDVNEVAEAIQWAVEIRGKYAAQQMLLLHGIARALHCKTVASKYRGTQLLHVFGMQHHIDRVQFLWGILRPQMLRLVETVRPDHIIERRKYDYFTGEVVPVKSNGQVRSFRRAWIAGFAQEIGDRLRAQEVQAVESAGGGALVLYRGDEKRAEEAQRQAFPRVRTAGRTSYNSAGWARGRQDGRSASLAPSLVGVA